jgi:3-oxoacyl-[acyl-carrier protein] reductase
MPAPIYRHNSTSHYMDENRTAIVTGVSRLKGIGKAICVELARRGINIFFTYWQDYDRTMPWDFSDNEPDWIKKEIRGLGVTCESIELNLENLDSVPVLLDAATRQIGQPSILIHNATYSTQTNLSTITASELEAHFAVNLRAPILLTAAFIQRLDKKHSGGRIINLTSGQSMSFMHEEVAYAVTKGAIETFTRTVSQELAERNITINAVNPGLTDSGWMTNEQRACFIDRFPMGRIGEPQDAAKIIGFLVSRDADWITGQIIHSEGGFIREKYE